MYLVSNSQQKNQVWKGGGLLFIHPTPPQSCYSEVCVLVPKSAMSEFILTALNSTPAKVYLKNIS